LHAGGNHGIGSRRRRLQIVHHILQIRQGRNRCIGRGQIGMRAYPGSTRHVLAADGDTTIGQGAVGGGTGAAAVLQHDAGGDVGVGSAATGLLWCLTLTTTVVTAQTAAHAARQTRHALVIIVTIAIQILI